MANEDSNVQPQDSKEPVTDTPAKQEEVTQPQVAPQDTSGPNPTHFNAFRQDVLDALADAHRAVGEAEEKFKALVDKLSSSV